MEMVLKMYNRRRADRIEAELLAVGATVLTRGLLGVLQNQSKK